MRSWSLLIPRRLFLAAFIAGSFSLPAASTDADHAADMLPLRHESDLPTSALGLAICVSQIDPRDRLDQGMVLHSELIGEHRTFSFSFVEVFGHSSLLWRLTVRETAAGSSHVQLFVGGTAPTQYPDILWQMIQLCATDGRFSPHKAPDVPLDCWHDRNASLPARRAGNFSAA